MKQVFGASCWQDKEHQGTLCQGNQWTWETEQQKAFEQIKADLKQAPILALYDPNKETKIAAGTLLVEQK